MSLGQRKIVIAVCGSAGGTLGKADLAKAGEIGRFLAEKGAIVLAPGMKGYSFEAGRAARKAGGLVIGMSPVESREEHLLKYGSSWEAFDFTVYSGFGLKGRNVLTIRSCDGVIFIGGGTGTLNEFTIAYDLGKPIGVLVGVQGTMELVDLVVEKTYKPSPGIYQEADPKKLVELIYREVADYHKRSLRS